MLPCWPADCCQMGRRLKLPEINENALFYGLREAIKKVSLFPLTAFQTPTKVATRVVVSTVWRQNREIKAAESGKQ